MAEDIMENKMFLLNNLKKLRGLDEAGNSGTVDTDLLCGFFVRGTLDRNRKIKIDDLAPGLYYKNSFEDVTYDTEYPYSDGIIMVLFVLSSKTLLCIRYNGEFTIKIKWGNVWSTSVIK